MQVTSVKHINFIGACCNQFIANIQLPSRLQFVASGHRCNQQAAALFLVRSELDPRRAILMLIHCDLAERLLELFVQRYDANRPANWLLFAHVIHSPPDSLPSIVGLAFMNKQTLANK